MQRRTLLKLGAGAAATLAIVGASSALVQPGLRQGRLTTAGRDVFSGVARAVLDGMLPVSGDGHAADLSAHLQRLDRVIGSLPASVQTELSQLLAMLAMAPGRIAFAGLRTPWPLAGVTEVQAALQGMRTSLIAARQQAYHALRDLTNVAYFSGQETWGMLGYPGPRPLA